MTFYNTTGSFSEENSQFENIILTVRLVEWGYKRINTVGSEGVN